MKKILLTIAIALALPLSVFAVATNVDRAGSVIQPLIRGDSIRAQFFTATSTTATSTFPIASSTCFWNGTACLTSGASLSGGVANEIAYWTSPTSIAPSPQIYIQYVNPYNYITIGTTTGPQTQEIDLYTSTVDLKNASLVGVNTLTLNTPTSGLLYNPGGGQNLQSADSYIYISTSTSRIGIGTTSPYAKLAIHDSSGLTGTNPLFTIASSSATGTGTTTLFSILGNGNVGINTTAPSEKLNVVGNVLATQFKPSGTTDYMYYGATTGCSAGLGTNFTLNQSEGVIIKAGCEGIASNAIGVRAYSGSFYNLLSGLGLYYFNTYTNTSNYERSFLGWSGNNLVLEAQQLGTGVQRNMVLQSAGGNVSIGTTTPASKLDVMGTTTVETGDVNIRSATGGVIMKDTVLGTCARVQLTSGVLVPTTVTCPF